MNTSVIAVPLAHGWQPGEGNKDLDVTVTQHLCWRELKYGDRIRPPIAVRESTGALSQPRVSLI